MAKFDRRETTNRTLTNLMENVVNIQHWQVHTRQLTAVQYCRVAICFYDGSLFEVIKVAISIYPSMKKKAGLCFH